MSAVKSFVLVMELATRKREQAETALVHFQKTSLAAQDQLVQLEAYASETESRWMISAQVSASPELMRHHYQFMGRLSHAIDLQKKVFKNTLQQVDLAKKTLLQTELRLASLRQIFKKKQAEIAIVRHKREQKHMDEFAAMQYSRLEAQRQTESFYE